MLLKITNGSIAFGANVVLEGINFSINEGEKIALVGRNGCGKTTLLKLIYGEYDLTKMDNGEESSIVKVKNKSIGYLKQVTFDDESITLEEEIKKAYKHIIDIDIRMKDLLHKMEKESNLELAKKYSELQEMYDLLGGYVYRSEYEVAIKRFGFSETDKLKPLSDFSGGQQTKIAFIRLLLSKPDILLLDEPTNHLDINAIEWIEEYLKSYKNSIVIVAHDREFLDKIVSIVYEIEWGKMTRYTGNYSDFAEKKRKVWELQQKKYIEQQREIARLSKLVDRFRYKATKASMAQSKIKKIEKIDIVKEPENADTKSFYVNFEPEYKSAQLVLAIEELKIGYDRTLSKLSLKVYRGDKIGIIGGNGLGKSTFVKTIMGKVKQLSGEYTLGDKVKVGYFDQHMAQYNSEKNVLDEYWDEFPDLKHTEVRSSLGAFLFTQDDVFKKVSDLSGGEKVKLELCKILKKKPNFLILDEPTNHMDIISKETLEKILKGYNGTIIFVSHDRYFVKQIASSILEFKDERVIYYPYGYNDYLEKTTGESFEEKKKEIEEKKEKKKPINPGKEKAKRKSKIKKLEKLISESDEKIDKLKAKINSDEFAVDYIKLTELQKELIEQEKTNLEYLEKWNILMGEIANT